jgi:hypothetical protein
MIGRGAAAATGQRLCSAVVRVLAGILIAAAFVAAMVYATHGETRVTCRVCVDYRGASECRSSSAAERDAAVAGAVANACAVMSGGVTDGIACTGTPPRLVECEE